MVVKIVSQYEYSITLPNCVRTSTTCRWWGPLALLQIRTVIPLRHLCGCREIFRRRVRYKCFRRWTKIATVRPVAIPEIQRTVVLCTNRMPANQNSKGIELVPPNMNLSKGMPNEPKMARYSSFNLH